MNGTAVTINALEGAIVDRNQVAHAMSGTALDVASGTIQNAMPSDCCGSNNYPQARTGVEE